MRKSNKFFFTLLVSLAYCLPNFSMVPLIRTTKLENIENKVTAFYTTKNLNHTIIGDQEGNVYLHDDATLQPCEKVFTGTGEVRKIIGSQDDRVIVVSFRAIIFNDNEQKDFIVILKWDCIAKTYKVSHRLITDETVDIYDLAVPCDNKSLFFTLKFFGSSKSYVFFIDLENIPRNEDNIVSFDEASINCWCQYEITTPVNKIFFPSNAYTDVASNEEINFFVHGKKVTGFKCFSGDVDEDDEPVKKIQNIGAITIPQPSKSLELIDILLSEDSHNNLVVTSAYTKYDSCIIYKTYRYDSRERKFTRLNTRTFNCIGDMHDFNKNYCLLSKSMSNDIGIFYFAGFELIDKENLSCCVDLNIDKSITGFIAHTVVCKNMLSILIYNDDATYTCMKVHFAPKKLLPWSRLLRSRSKIYKLNKKFVLKKDSNNKVVIVSEQKHKKEEANNLKQESIDLDDFAYASSFEEDSEFEEWENESRD